MAIGKLIVHLLVSALLLWLVSQFVSLVPGFHVASFTAALIGGLLLGLFNLAASAVLNRR
jgi:uncharacterized membrane protein YvlD (DUF360 family)